MFVFVELGTNTTTWSIHSSTSSFSCCFTQCITGWIGCITTTLWTKFGYGRFIQYAYYKFKSRWRCWCCRLQNGSWQHDVLFGKIFFFWNIYATICSLFFMSFCRTHRQTLTSLQMYLLIHFWVMKICIWWTWVLMRVSTKFFFFILHNFDLIVIFKLVWRLWCIDTSCH